MPKITIRYDGVFDFDQLYSQIIEWAKNYGYMWHEAAFKHKVPSSAGAEQEYIWLLSKNVTEFIQFKILFTVHVWDMNEIETEVNGRKKTLTKARLYIKMDGTVNWDWQERFKRGGWLGKKLGIWFEKIRFKDIAVYMEQLYYRMWNLHALIKKYFDMQTKKYEYKRYLGEN